MHPLLILQFLPLFGALLLFFVPKKRADIAAVAAFLLALAEVVLAVRYLPWGLSANLPAVLGVTAAFSYDTLSGIAVIVVAASTMLTVLYSIFMPQNPGRSPSFYALMLMVLFGTVGAALARDLVQFYIFWEVMLIPAWALVYYWNEDPRRAPYVGLKFFIITHIGAVAMLLSILWIYSLTGTTNMAALGVLLPSLSVQTLTVMALLFLMAFVTKLGIFPFHTWLPDAYTSSVMPVTLLLVGVMTNIGVYGFARFLPFFPAEATAALSLPLLIFALITMFYGGLLALVDKNAKRIVAYSSMSQMGYVLFGFATLLPQGMAGSVFNLVNQAATKLALFMCLGIVFEYSRTQNIEELGGWAKRLPFAALGATVAVLSLVGAPPLAGFWPEILTFSAGFTYGNYTIAVLALVASVITAAYGLRLARKVFFGPLAETHAGEVLAPRWTGTLAAGVSILALVVLGVYPALAFNHVRKAIAALGFFLGG